jgi:hypothetical protein
MKIKLCGEFILVNEELLREKASRPYDPAASSIKPYWIPVLTKTTLTWC